MALVVTSCGGGDGDDAALPTATSAAPTTVEVTTPASTSPPITPTTQPPTTEPSPTTPPTTEAPTTTEPVDPPDTDLCAALDSDDPPNDLAAVVPVEHVAAAQLIVDLTAALDEMSSIPSDVLDRFVDPAGISSLEAFADAAEAECGQIDAVNGLRFYADVGKLAAPEANPAYCVSLADIVSLETSDEATTAAIASALETAPEEHRPGLLLIESLMESGDVLPDGFDVIAATEQIAGLGLYAEARCDVPDAFVSMFFVASFLGGAGDLGGESGAGLGTTPEPADISAAQAAVPAGSDVTFETVDLDLQDDGDYLTSAVVPAGWELNDSAFGKTFEAGDGFGIFTEISFDAGCDGMCEVTDWDARLNGPDGYVTLYRAENDMIIDRPTEGTDGIVMVKSGLGDGVDGAVLRWAEGTDRYFVCDFELEGENLDLVDAFVAACESARPGWIIAG